MRHDGEPADAIGHVRWRDAGLPGPTPGRLRGPGWQRVTRGIYLPAGATGTRMRATATSYGLPRQSGFGHLTSAELRGWWLPNGMTSTPVLFASTTSKVHVQRHGLYVRRSQFTATDTIDDLPVVTAAETLLELAQDLSLVDLVPLVDCALAAGAGKDELLAAARPRSRGSVILRRAVVLGDERSESWWESILRLMHVLTGLGPVECQVDVADQAGFVARADLHLVGTVRYPECDGRDHRDRDQHQRDLRRDRAMHRTGAERYGYTPKEIAHLPRMIIRDAEDARHWPHDPARVTRWWQLVRASTVTGHGRAQLNARLARYRRAARR